MNYYKILNEKECHNGFQYKTGLNIDIQEFNPNGDCKPGGIYFSREDVLAFLNYGPWIRKVTIPKDAKVYQNPGTPVKWKADRIILGRKYRITAKVIERLIKEGADPKARDSAALRLASSNGYFDIVKLLLPYSDPKARDSAALRLASQNGHLEIVKLLLPLSDSKANDSEALRLASECGYLEIVKLLLPLSDPKACDSEALRLASEYGYLEIVKLLMEFKK